MLFTLGRWAKIPTYLSLNQKLLKYQAGMQVGVHEIFYKADFMFMTSS